jgi:hypothetical protein
VLLARLRVFDPEVVVPAAYVKLRLDGVALMVGLVVAVVTFRVTGRLTGVLDAPVPATETDPV